MQQLANTAATTTTTTATAKIYGSISSINCSNYRRNYNSISKKYIAAAEALSTAATTAAAAKTTATYAAQSTAAHPFQVSDELGLLVVREVPHPQPVSHRVQLGHELGGQLLGHNVVLGHVAEMV